MNGFKTIRVAHNGRGVATLTLARPQKRNALNGRMIGELRAALAALSAEEETRAVVLTAEGNSFCGGADLDWIRELQAMGLEQRIAEASELAGLLEDLSRMPKPIVARVQGGAFGGGVGLLSVCDVVVAAPVARFALTEVRLGLIPATIAPFVVARIGEAAARYLMLSGRVIDAIEARRVGLVSVVSAPTELDANVEGEVAQLILGAPGAIAAAKLLCRELAMRSDPGTSGATAVRLAQWLESKEAREGVSAFLAGSTPDWQRAVPPGDAPIRPSDGKRSSDE